MRSAGTVFRRPIWVHANATRTINVWPASNFDCFALIQAQAVYWSWLQLIFRRYRGNRIDSMAEVREAIQCTAPLKATESITLDPCGSQGWLDENRYSSLVCCRQTSQLHKQAIIVINWFQFNRHTSNTAFAIDFSVSTSFNRYSGACACVLRITWAQRTGELSLWTNYNECE